MPVVDEVNVETLPLSAQGTAAAAEREPEPVLTPRGRLRRLARRILAKRLVWLLIALPLGWMGIELWHRMGDAFETRPIKTVTAVGTSNELPGVETPGFVSAISALTETAIVPGNQVELLLDGSATLTRIEADARSSKKSIVVQTYYCAPGKVAERLKQVMMSKAQQGLSVLFLPDAFGCGSLGDGYFDSLRTAGVRVAKMRPFKWYSLHRSLHRSHVRVAIIDSKIAYTGGFGFADKWLPNPDGPPWQETTVRFRGPAVAELAGAFGIAWADATGELLAGDGIFPDAFIPDEGTLAGVMFTTRTYGTPVPERYLSLSLAAARRHVYIANPYFIPNKDLRKWLKEAVARGVDVHILTASSNIDVKFTRWAGRSTYEELLAAGVKIYEYTPSMLHAKTMVIDGVFVSVGSLNLDNISLRINDEAVLLSQDSTLAAALEKRFLADIAKAEKITLAKFKKRPLYEKLTQWVALVVRDYM
ncbi:MAG: phospholipase D-like domain-containing protein [Gemmatimonas sp.]